MCGNCGEHRSRCTCDEEPNQWRDLYYHCFGMIRNEIRTTNSAQIRLDNISEFLEGIRPKHLALEKEDENKT